MATTYTLSRQVKSITPVSFEKSTNRQIKKRQPLGPTLATINKWHQEFVQSDYQFRMSFQQFRKLKMQDWRKQRNQKTSQSSRPRIKAQSLDQVIAKETVFIKGKYQGQKIETIVKYDPSYCAWCLERSPRSIVSQQIIAHFNR